MTYLLVLAALMAPPASLETLIETAHTQRLSADPVWRAFGHYRSGAWGDYSEIDGEDFFLAPNGSRDPKAELTATLRAFAAPAVTQAPPAPVSPEDSTNQTVQPKPKAHAQCRFPARYAWLVERLGITPAQITPQQCPELAMWREAIGAQGLSLFFADAYPNSPGSMFGHTMLRFDRGDRTDLRDYVLTFGTPPEAEQAFLYAFQGMFGMFKGTYSTLPFYLKVQEYAHVESRDMWRWTVNLSPQQLRRVVDHAWEMTHTHLDYYFFDENCSYQLLTLLDVAFPVWQPSQSFGLGVIPADVVRVLAAREGLLSDLEWRPSHASQLRLHLQGLNGVETQAAQAAAAGDLAPVRKLQPPRAARALDAAHSLMRFEKGYVRDGDADYRKRERTVLIARAKLGVRQPPVEMRTDRQSPARGHGTARAGVGASLTQGDGTPAARLSLRGALHDLLDPPAGYLPNTQLQVLDMAARADAQSVVLEHAWLLDIMSLWPLERHFLKPSWRVRGGVTQGTDLGCFGWSCLLGNVRAGLGPSFGLGGAHVLYALAEFDGRFLGQLPDGASLGFGGTFGWTSRWGRWGLHASGSTHRDVWGASALRWAGEIGQSVHLSSDWALRLTGRDGGQHTPRSGRLEVLRAF